MSRRPRGFWKSLEQVAPSFAEVAASLKSGKETTGALGMPSRAQLRALGRTDLLHVLAKHSTEAVAAAAGLELNGAGLGVTHGCIYTWCTCTAHQRRLMQRHHRAS